PLAAAAFHIVFFLNLDNLKKHLLRLVEIELSVKFSPPFANTFSVSGNLMDKYNFYKSLYDRELNRRNDLDASINLPLTIIGILITTNAYLAKNLFPLESICKMNY